MRLRRLSEAECYARCYGGHTDERVAVVRLPLRRVKSQALSGEHLRRLFEERLDARDLEDEAA
jgi:hypothetical protein